MLAANNLLHVEDLVLHFRTSQGPVQAVDGVDIDLDHNRAVVILGESGGVASIRWVRPDFTTPSQRRAFASKVRESAESASMTAGASSRAASRMAVGTTSF